MGRSPYNRASPLRCVIAENRIELKKVNSITHRKRINPCFGQFFVFLNKKENMEATFGGGCFWCTEVIFQHTKGVEEVVPGYMGGRTENPTYEQVCMGNTDHVEVVRVVFDDAEVSFRDLLEIFFKTHDPTTLNRQGGDVGTQYRSVVFYHNDQQKQEAEELIALLGKEKVYESPIVTAIESASRFWEAENYHHDYFHQNPQNQFCQVVVAPKLQKFLTQFKSHARA